MRDRLRNEDGFTLPELLITLAIGLIVTLSAFTLVEVTMHRSGDIAARIEAVQSGRGAMDTITRQLRSQVCLTRNTTPGEPRVSIEAADSDSVTVFVDMRDTSNNALPVAAPAPGTISGPEKHQVTYVPGPPEVGGKLIETTWKPTAVVSGVYQYGGVPPTTRELLTSVERAKTVPGNVTIPVFQYFKYDFTAAEPQPTVPLPGTLTAEQIKGIAKIQITYRANPAQKRKDSSASTVFTNQVYTRTVDPNADTDELSEPCK